MKISKKRFEEILLEEVKVFVQEKKLEEEKVAPYDKETGEKTDEYAAKVAAARIAYQKRHWLTPSAISGAKFDAMQAEREDPEKRANAATKKRRAKRNVSENETNEDCGDMPAPKKTIKIKIKQ
jgi:hypothetical protein